MITIKKKLVGKSLALCKLLIFFVASLQSNDGAIHDCVKLLCFENNTEENPTYCTNTTGLVRNETFQSLLRQLNSSEMLVRVLESHVSWNLFNNKTENVACLSPNMNCSSKCWKKQCLEIDDDVYYRKHWSAFLSIAIVSMIANLTILVLKTKTLATKKFYEEKMIYNTLVLNLSLSNFLFGLYLALISIKNKSTFPDCNTLGVISITSLQVSTTVLVFISAYRLYGVIKPFESVSVRFLFFLLALTWVSWFIISLVPILLKNSFTSEISIGGDKFNINLFRNTIYKTAKSLSNNTSDMAVVFKTVARHISKSVVIQLLKSFSITKSNITKPLTIYNAKHDCTLNFVNFISDGRYYMLFIILYNLFAFGFMLISYIVIFVKMFLKEQNFILNLFLCRLQYKEKNNEHLNKNLAVFKTTFAVVVTDFFIWNIICVISLYFYFIYTVTTNDAFCKILKAHHRIQKLIMILILINPLINPFIYSFNFWKPIFKYCKEKFL